MNRNVRRVYEEEICVCSFTVFNYLNDKLLRRIILLYFRLRNYAVFLKNSYTCAIIGDWRNFIVRFKRPRNYT